MQKEKRKKKISNLPLTERAPTPVCHLSRGKKGKAPFRASPKEGGRGGYVSYLSQSRKKAQLFYLTFEREKKKRRKKRRAEYQPTQKKGSSLLLIAEKRGGSHKKGEEGHSSSSEKKRARHSSPPLRERENRETGYISSLYEVRGRRVSITPADDKKKKGRKWS